MNEYGNTLFFSFLKIDKKNLEYVVSYICGKTENITSFVSLFSKAIVSSFSISPLAHNNEALNRLFASE